MLESFLPYMRVLDIRAIPPYQLFLKEQSKIIRERYIRIYKSLGHETRGVSLLRYILQFMDMDYMKRQANNYDRYLYHVRFIKKSLEETFDRVRRGAGYSNMFFNKSDFSTSEYIVPAEDINTITNLPLETNGWASWRKVRPLRLIAHDSNEYTINFLNDRFTYSDLPPSYAVLMLDVVALVFKYWSWYHTQRANEEAQDLAQDAPHQLFLHKYVLCDLIWDNADVWLLNTLANIQSAIADGSYDPAMIQHESLQTEQQYGRIHLGATAGFEYLVKLFQGMSQTYRPEGILNTRVLFSGTISNRINELLNRWDMPILEQYDYLRWLRDRQLIAFFINSFKAKKDYPPTKRLLYYFTKDFRRLLGKHPWRYCVNIALKYEIESDMTSFLEKL